MALKKPFIGQMDRKVTVFRIVKTQSPSGAVVAEDQLIASPWAQMSESGGGENLEGKEMHEASRTYTVRHNPAIKAGAKDFVLEDSGVRYSITHIEEIGRKAYMSLKTVLYE